MQKINKLNKKPYKQVMHKTLHYIKHIKENYPIFMKTFMICLLIWSIREKRKQMINIKNSNMTNKKQLNTNQIWQVH